MMYPDVIYGACEPEQIKINEREFELRIGGKGLYNMEETVKCHKALLKIIKYRYAYACLDVAFLDKNECCIESEKIKSEDLYKNLNCCKKVYIMAVTLGVGVDRLLSRLRISSPGEYIITDALASAAVEALCDYVDEEIKKRNSNLKNVIWKPRYSPGYGDCSIKNQKFVINRLNGESKLGILLNEFYFMTPSKSITAIMGMKYE